MGRKAMSGTVGRALRGVAAVCGLATLGLGAGPAGAEPRFSVEGFGALGTGAKTGALDFEKKFSGGGGIGYDVSRHLQVRADGAVFSWDGSFTRTLPRVGICFQTGSQLICLTGGGGTSTVRQELRSTPVFLGGRYFIGSAKLRPYVEAGAGIHPVTLEVTTSGSSAITTSEKSTKFGAIPGAGLQYKLGKSVGLGLGGRYYYVPKGVGEADDVESSFFSATASLVLRF